MIQKERGYSWDIPIYIGATGEFVVVTSPALVNGGLFTLEARRVICSRHRGRRLSLSNRIWRLYHEATRIERLDNPP